MINKAILIGNLTRDPDNRVTTGGNPVCSFTIAVNRRYVSQSGERQVDYIPVVCWRSLAENCSKYLKKGSKAAVTGQIQTRTYDAKDGSKRYITEIVADEVEFLSGSSQAAFGDGEKTLEQAGFTQLSDDDGLPF